MRDLAGVSAATIVSGVVLCRGDRTFPKRHRTKQAMQQTDFSETKRNEQSLKV